MRKPTVVLYDLDSTMANVHHREHLSPALELRSDKRNWIPYSQACVDDTPIAGVAATARLHNLAGHRIHFVSGRNFEALEQTEWWLKAHQIPFDEIRLNKFEDLRHNGEFKVEYIKSLIERGLEPVLMYEDHISVGEMIETETGVLVVTVRPRYEDGVGVSFNLSQHPELVGK